MAAAIGERMTFCVQAKRTAFGRSPGTGKILARFPAKCNHFAEKKSRQINMLEHVLVAKPLDTLAGHALAPPMQDTDQREQPPCRVKIDIDLAVEPFLENFAAVIVQGAPRHVQRFNL